MRDEGWGAPNRIAVPGGAGHRGEHESDSETAPWSGDYDYEHDYDYVARHPLVIIIVLVIVIRSRFPTEPEMEDEGGDALTSACAAVEYACFFPGASVAQLVEQRIRNAQVIGSTPIAGSTLAPGRGGWA